MRILGLYVGDANGDGKNELLVVREGGIDVYVWTGQAFEQSFTIDAPINGFNKRAIVVDDVDLDGIAETVVGYTDKDGRIHIDVYKRDELVTSIASSIPGGEVYGLFIVDVNDDKNQEIIAFGSNSQGFTTMTVWYPTKPRLMRADRVPIGKEILDCYVGDVNGDGRIEALVLSRDELLHRAYGERKFKRYPIEVYDVHTIGLADVNGDLFLELILGSRSGVYVYSGLDLMKEYNKSAETLIVHDVDNDGSEEIVITYANHLCSIDVENDEIECTQTKKAVKYLAAGKFADQRLIIAADDEEFRIAAQYSFAVPNVIEEFHRISSKYKPLIADYILKIAFGLEAHDLKGELLLEARKALISGDINRAYRKIYEVLEGDVPNPKKAARIAVLLSYYLMKNPASKVRELLESLAGGREEKKEEKKKKKAVNPREALERIKLGTATEDDLIAAVALFIHDPNRLKGKVPRFFEKVREQFGSAAALDSLLAIFPVAPKSLKSEILITIIANYLQGKLFPNEIRAAFKRAARKNAKYSELFELFADVVLKYGQRGMAALISALSYTKANPDAVKKLIPEPTFTFKLSRPQKLEEIPIPDARLVPLILYGRVNVTMKGKNISDLVFWIHP